MAPMLFAGPILNPYEDELKRRFGIAGFQLASSSEDAQHIGYLNVARCWCLLLYLRRAVS